MSTNPFAGKWAADMWGMIARQDWKDFGGGNWNISGSSQPDMYGGPVFDSREQAEAYIAANRPAGPTPSENAYNASLQAQGISPSELPMSAGQELTARVLQQHGLPIPDYLRAFLGRPAGGGNSAQPGLLPDAGLTADQLGDNYLGGNISTYYPAEIFGRMGGGSAPDPMQNTIAARFLARTQEEANAQKQQMLREFIKQVMLAGQQKKQPVSPGLVAAAMGRVAV